MTVSRFYSPQSIAEATAILRQQSGCQVLAGGTDLLVQMRNGVKQPEYIVDIKEIPGIRDVTLTNQGLTLGAAAPAQSVTERPDIAAAYPGLVEAIDMIGSTQIQGRCSVGGNLCNASPAADTVPALIAVGAVCHVVGGEGVRQVRVEDFNTGPGENCLKRDELLISLFIPRPGVGSADAYLRFTPRTEMDIAVVGAGVSLSLDPMGTVSAARVAIGAAAPTALLVEEAAAAIIGTTLEESALAALAAAAGAAASPISDKRGSAGYRTKVVGVMARRAAQIACDRAQQRQRRAH
ncbi:xanthine dehydrogenase family protein subunit M [Halieaceae bacterium IMCC14734]|uniref:Xanthine dehydrogenase family protein subunit M n=1 Tax=Candidatus Litorirhabdus singularis TaxID=2518993 RepID=A0ABT3THW7_9GAMM|nr:xanthine dehydrogenase family protein subunit M [Candidatus Litorirhabdus singularis]MCX2981014.1 xanthine dehydrogenase family protein subunit M [Candidatus Litorirhabdus singularis]